MVTWNGLGALALADGRRLDTWHGGDLDGVPVLYFHGTPAGRLQAALGDGAARRVGVHLLAFSRPGYGASTDSRTSLTTVARDAVEVADALGVGARFATLGASGGGPFALATAAVSPERVTSVGVVAGVGPLLELDPRVADDPAVRLALAGDPDGALAVREAALGNSPDTSVGRADADVVGAFSALAPEAEHDTVPPEMLEPWARDLRDAVPTFRGASRDSLAFAVGWDVDLDAVRAPVRLWYGGNDHLVPPEHGRWLHERLPTSTLVVREGVGHLGSLVPYWSEVLTALRRLARSTG